MGSELRSDPSEILPSNQLSTYIYDYLFAETEVTK